MLSATWISVLALAAPLAAPEANPTAAQASSRPALAAPDEDDAEDPVSDDGAEADEKAPDAVDDEAGELWKLQELEAQTTGPALLNDEPFLPEDDLDAARRFGSRDRRTHPEEIASLLESNPAVLFGRQLMLPVTDALWPMFVETSGAELFDPKNYDIPLELHPMVEQWIKFFTGSGRQYFTRWLSRSTRYIPIFREIMKEHGLPQDTVYLSMIESGFNMRAFSRAKASGPWQFMSYTGKRFGLKLDSWIDDRRDWIKSTHAAARYLKELHQQLGHWYLAWAGYNAGGGKMSRAINKYDSRDFWELTKGRFLHPETKNYVPKLIAAAIVAKSPRRFGFTDIEWQRPFEFELVTVDGGLDLRHLAGAAGVDHETLLEMNPALKYGITPPGTKWELRIPKGNKARFLAQLPSAQPKTKYGYKLHLARRGETLTGIAAGYGSSVELIREYNHLGPDNRLRRGIELLVPTIPGVKPVAMPKPEPAPAPRVAVKDPAVAKSGVYVVQAGDSLWSISQAYGCTVADLKRMNGINNHRGLQAGQAIKIPQ